MIGESRLLRHGPKINRLPSHSRGMTAWRNCSKHMSRNGPTLAFRAGQRKHHHPKSHSLPPATEHVSPRHSPISLTETVSTLITRHFPTMQRPTYPQSPPLHHPVPQHVSTVPQLRSPPPPSLQSQGGYDGSPYQPQPQQNRAPSGGPNVFGQYGNFINDPAAQIASQFGQTAFRQGQEYLEQNVSSNNPNCSPTHTY